MTAYAALFNDVVLVAVGVIGLVVAGVCFTALVIDFRDQQRPTLDVSQVQRQLAVARLKREMEADAARVRREMALELRREDA